MQEQQQTSGTTGRCLFNRPEQILKLGSLLGEIGRQVDMSSDEFAVFDHVRSQNPAEPAKFV